MTFMAFLFAAMGALFLAQNMTMNSGLNDFRVTAGVLANEKVEEILADKAFRGYNYIENNNYPAETLGDEFSRYTREIDIEEVSSSDYNSPHIGSGIKRVQVRVSWYFPRTQHREFIQVITLVSNT